MKYYFLFQTAEESNIDPVKRLKKKRSGTSTVKGKVENRTFTIDLIIVRYWPQPYKNFDGSFIFLIDNTERPTIEDIVEKDDKNFSLDETHKHRRR